MTFDSHVAGIPCQVAVLRYDAGLSMRITGSGFGDADPPEPEEFEFELRDRKGYRARWLEEKLSEDDESRLLAEYRAEESEAA